MHNEPEIRAFLVAEVRKAAQARGAPADGIGDDLDLIDSGLFDSLGYVRLVAALEERFGISIDFEELDPEEMVRLRGLILAVSRAPAGG
jgi:acyl carrier protein